MLRRRRLFPARRRTGRLVAAVVATVGAALAWFVVGGSAASPNDRPSEPEAIALWLAAGVEVAVVDAPILFWGDRVDLRIQRMEEAEGDEATVSAAYPICDPRQSWRRQIAEGSDGLQQRHAIRLHIVGEIRSASPSDLIVAHTCTERAQPSCEFAPSSADVLLSRSLFEGLTVSEREIVIAHEIGHALGFAHPTADSCAEQVAPETSVMSLSAVAEAKSLDELRLP